MHIDMDLESQYAPGDPVSLHALTGSIGRVAIFPFCKMSNSIVSVITVFTVF